MERAEILDAIRRCAVENGGVAVGRRRFQDLTGIRASQWEGKFWARWSDAIIEAGFEPGGMNAAHSDDGILTALAQLVRELGKYPVSAELALKRRSDPTFPSPKVFERYGNKAAQAARLVSFCELDPALSDVAAIALPVAAKPVSTDAPTDGENDGSPTLGQVYLLKSGQNYKIGRSNSAGRRQYELAIQLPEPVERVHVIDTDDAVGIERYWHERFAHRRLNGEWFRLTPSDVAAFRRRKHFM